MLFLNLTLDRTSENLALDEALLEAAEGNVVQNQPSAGVTQVARLWEPRETAVIVGRGSKVSEEVDLDYCERNSIPVFRRHSGGASVVIGPGCFLYSVVIDFRQHPQLRDLTQAHHFVVSRVRNSLLPRVPHLEIQGVCDLTVSQKKVSGNSLKVARNHFMYHGTILYDFDLEKLCRCLRTPPRQPEYRQGRSHGDFVANLPITDPAAFAVAFPSQFQDAWEANVLLDPWPAELTSQLAREKYESKEWNFRR